MTSRSEKSLMQLDPALEQEIVDKLRPGLGLLLVQLLGGVMCPPPGVWRRMSFDYCLSPDGAARVVRIQIVSIEEP